jgi:flagellar M-ring protein FliF
MNEERVDEEEEENAPAAPRLRRRRSKGGPSLRDELVEIVREDPDAAANILRNWIGTAN